MTDTVRIMPRQPFEVALGNGRYWPTAETQQRATYFPAEHWHEVSDPIVWDGSDESFRAIREALAHGQGVLEVWLGDDEYEPHIEITSRSTLNRVGLVVHGAGVRIEGDTFSIHPPKDGDA